MAGVEAEEKTVLKSFTQTFFFKTKSDIPHRGSSGGAKEKMAG